MWENTFQKKKKKTLPTYPIFLKPVTGSSTYFFMPNFWTVWDNQAKFGIQTQYKDNQAKFGIQTQYKPRIQPDFEISSFLEI